MMDENQRAARSTVRLAYGNGGTSPTRTSRPSTAGSAMTAGSMRSASLSKLPSMGKAALMHSDSLPAVGTLVPINTGPTSLPSRPLTPYEEEGSLVIRRNRELEAAIKRLGSQLIRERKIHHAHQEKAERVIRQTESRRREWEQGWEEQLARVRAECDAKLVAAEREQMRANSVEGQLEALKSSVEEQAQRVAEQERERRVELLARQSVRRMINQQLVMGFTAWAELYEARMRKKRIMQQSMMRLAKPAVAASFRFWQEDWQYKLREDEAAKSLLQETQLKGAQSVLEHKYRLMVAEYESKLKAAMNEKNDAIQALQQELHGRVKLTEEETLAKAKEERIEHLRRTSVRRMMSADLAWGWSCWFDLWSAKTYALSRLRQVANKLKSPELYDAFSFWYADAMDEKRARLANENQTSAEKLANATKHQAQMERQIEELRAELEQVAKERDSLAGGLSSLESSAAEKARLVEEQLQFEKEQRIELLARQVGRRMMNQGIIRGWTMWFELWETKVQQRNMLKAAANRLMKPALTAAFAHWNGDWQAAVREAEHVAHLQHLEALRGASNSLEVQMALLKEELAEKQATFEIKLQTAEEEKVRALEHLRVELTGTLEERAEKEREERIELLKRQAARRIMSADIAWGWSAWKEMWAAKMYAMTRLREVANHLRAPGLGSAFAFWARDTYEAHARNESQAQVLVINQLKADTASLEAQLLEQAGLYEEKLAAAAAEADSLRGVIDKLAGGVQEGEAALQAAMQSNKAEKIEALQKRVVRRMLNAELSGAFIFWMLDAQESRKRADMLESEGALERLRTERAELAEELKMTKFEHERAMMGVEEQMMKALEELRIELVGTAEEQLAAAEEREREERIEMMKRQAGRRMMNADLAWGWNGWFDYWAAYSRLREIGSRFRAPALGQAFTQWYELCQARTRAKQLQALENASKSLEGQLRSSLFEAGQLRLLRTANQQEITHLKAKLREKENEASEVTAKLVEMTPAIEDNSDEIEQLKRLVAESQEIAATEIRKREEAEVETFEQREANQKLLEQLVLEQRAAYDRDLNALKGQLANAKEEKVELDKVLETTKHDARVAQAKLDKIKKDKEDARKAKEEAKNKKYTFIMDDPSNPVAGQLAIALREGSTRVIDLFRQWDKDGDGKVDRQEFINAMPKFGFDLPSKDIGKLFDEWDSDGGGSLSFKELTRILKKPRPSSSSRSSRPGTPGSVGVAKEVAVASAADRFKQKMKSKVAASPDRPPAVRTSRPPSPSP